MCTIVHVISSKIKRRKTTPDRREQILQAALTLIAAEGVASVTHRRIAEEAGVPLGSTTYYFETLDQLLREAFVYHIERATQIYDATASEQPVTDAESLASYLAELSLREFEEGSFLLGEYELTLFATRDEEVADALSKWDESMIAALARSLDRIGVSAPFEAGRTLLHLMRGHELECLTRKAFDIEALKHRLGVVINAYAQPSTNQI